MNGSQPQLFQIALDPGDVVYTPDFVARDMVDFFKPSGRILEPCAGDGVFLKYLPPDTEWCEIEKGRDFFSWRERLTWIIGNPPYSTDLYLRWMLHSFYLAENVVYITPTNKIFQSFSVMDMISEYGGIRAILCYGGGNSVGFPFGFSVGAFHFQRGYTGETRIVFRRQNLPLQ